MRRRSGNGYANRRRFGPMSGRRRRLSDEWITPSPGLSPIGNGLVTVMSSVCIAGISMHHNQETEPTQNAPEVNPLSLAAESIDTSYPLLAPDQICEFEIVSAKKETVKGHTDREMLVLKLKTVKDYRSKDRNALRSGFVVMKRIGITPRPEEDGMKERGWDEIRKDLALVLKGVGRPRPRLVTFSTTSAPSSVRWSRCASGSTRRGITSPSPTR